MKHLSNDQLVDAAEDATTSSAHLEICGACRARVNELRQMLAMTQSVEVPEPSPLFWDHFSDRVRAAVATESPEPPRVGAVSGWLPSLAGALAVIVIGFAVTMRSGQTPEKISTPPATATVNENPTEVPVTALSEDPSWTLMGELTSQIDWDHAEEAGLGAMPGSADRVLQEMTIDEQRLVLELLQQEIRNGSQL